MKKKNTMKERPILFSTPMVQAILNGTKTQTRRKCKDQNEPEALKDFAHEWEKQNMLAKCPYGKSGDVLWVKETWFNNAAFGAPIYVYRADGEFDDQFPRHKEGGVGPFKWKPSIFMPMEACRIKLLIKDVRVERLWDISNVDALDEGISVLDEKFIKKHFPSYHDDLRHWKNNKKEAFTKPPLGPSPRAKFLALWESINGIESRDQNPYTWVLTFERI